MLVEQRTASLIRANSSRSADRADRCSQWLDCDWTVHVYNWSSGSSQTRNISLRYGETTASLSCVYTRPVLQNTTGKTDLSLFQEAEPDPKPAPDDSDSPRSRITEREEEPRYMA